MKKRILYYDNIRYFAAKSGRKKGSLAKYTLNRYIQFALMGVFVNTLYLTVDLFNVFPNKSITVAQVIQSGLLLSDDIFPPFWCMKLFLLGGVICYANKKYEVPTAIRSAVHASCNLLLVQAPDVSENVLYSGGLRGGNFSYSSE